MTYIYYRLYKHFLKINAANMPEFNAASFITLFEFLNLVTILQLLPITISSLTNSLKLGLLSYVFPLLALLTINHFVLRKDIPRLTEKYKDEPFSSKLRGTILLFAYIIISFAAFLLVINFK